MSGRAEALFEVAERGIADEIVLRRALVGMPNGEERDRLLEACRVIERSYERANEAAMYLRGLERGYDLRKGIALEEDDPRIKRNALQGGEAVSRRVHTPESRVRVPALPARRDVDDLEAELWGRAEPLL